MRYHSHIMLSSEFNRLRIVSVSNVMLVINSCYRTISKTEYNLISVFNGIFSRNSKLKGQFLSFFIIVFEQKYVVPGYNN